MRAMVIESIAPLVAGGAPLKLVELPVPVPAADEILIQVAACGVCHTEIDEIEGRTPPPRLPVVPGHEVIGRVAGSGADCHRYEIGERLGIGWIHRSSGTSDENLSPEFCATGRDVNGGYAEYMTVTEPYAYPIPDIFSDAEAAPLMCAGAVGYRALRACGLADGQLLGLTGFGGSAHLVLQTAQYLYPAGKIFVFARSDRERKFALDLGAAWAGDTDADPPQKLHAIIDTTPVWRPVVAALRALRPGGRLVINAIRKEDHDRELLANLSYAEHLWLEKELKTVANVTARDIREFLAVAARIPIRPEVQVYPLEQANEAIQALHSAHVRGTKVLKINF